MLGALGAAAVRLQRQTARRTHSSRYKSEWRYAAALTPWLLTQELASHGCITSRRTCQGVERHGEAGQAAEGGLVLRPEVLDKLEEALQRACRKRLRKQLLACARSVFHCHNEKQERRDTVSQQ